MMPSKIKIARGHVRAPDSLCSFLHVFWYVVCAAAAGRFQTCGVAKSPPCGSGIVSNAGSQHQPYDICFQQS
ncbi:hypothetical protein MRB53_041614 [Persea americana]|nr:hypothetical protein MRB53_041614 [Persea americana]